LRRTRTPGVSARKVPLFPSCSASYASLAPSTKRSQHPLRWAKVNCHYWAKLECQNQVSGVSSGTLYFKVIENNPNIATVAGFTVTGNSGQASIVPADPAT